MYPANRDDILKGLNDLVVCMEKLLSTSDNTSEQEMDEKALAVRFKLIKNIVYQVDNSLGDFQDLLDTMDYHQDDKYDEAFQLVNKVEELTVELIDFLRKHNQY